MKPLLLVAVGLLAATIGTAGQSAREALSIDDIEWTARDADPSRPGERRVQFTSGQSRSSASIEAAKLAIAPESDGTVGFTLVREPGSLACRGKRGTDRLRGTCRFTGSLAFEDALAARGVTLRKRRDLFGLALVDATTTLVDDLAREGYPIRHHDDLMAVAALEVTGAYVRSLKTAGLRARGIDDLVACRALGVDEAFLRAMAAAGYPSLEAREAIELRAVGVTPDYAETMNRVVGALRAVDLAGGMQ